MKNTKKALIFAVLAAVVVFCFIAGCTDPGNVSDENLYIIHTNDVHGYFSNNLGYTSVAALYQQMQEEGKNVLLLDAGDFVQGSVELKATQGESAVHIMNLAGYQVSVPGNHEFDYGLDHLLELQDEMDFAFISANIFYKGTDKLVFQPNTIIEIGGHKVGIFGLETPDTAVTTYYKDVEDVDFASGEDLYRIAQEQVDYLKGEGCDIIICIGHLGVSVNSEPNRSTDLVPNVEGIDLFIDGHSHTVLKEGEVVNDTLIVQTGTALKYIGLVTITPDGNITETLIDKSTGNVEEIDEFAANISAHTHEVYGNVVCMTDVELTADKNMSRTQETNLGDLTADSMMYTAEIENISADFAIVNAGSIRSPIKAGNVTEYDLLNVFPFGNSIVATDMDGQMILQMFEDQTQSVPDPRGGFPQVSGIHYTVDATKPYVAGEVNRVTIDSIQGQLFDVNATYTVLLNDYTVNGGDNYPNVPLLGGTYVTLDHGLEDGLIHYITVKLNGDVGEAYAKPQGRITIITNESIPKATLTPGTPTNAGAAA